MIEAFVGLVGGGKTFSSVRRMCNYMSTGGVVVSNILLSGYDTDTKQFSPESPVLIYLRDALQWEYQEGQYIYISFEDMSSLPGWFKRVPGGQSRDKRTFLCIDEATDLFDSLDRGKLNNDSVYRELFRFLRLSRHAHIDVLFICQDLNAINIRLRGLVGCIWRSTDMSNFRIGGLRVAIPINCFLLQQFDRTGKLELRREFVSKDSRIFSLYESEAFHDDLGVTFSPPVKDGKLKGGKKKMTMLERAILVLCVLCLLYLIFFTRSLSRDVSTISNSLRSIDIEKVPGKEKVPGNFVEKTPNEDSKGFFSLLSSGSSGSNVESSPNVPSRTFIRGVFSFTETPKERYCFVDGHLYKVGMLTEYGLCKVVSKNSVICVDGLHETILLPCVDAGGASGVSLQAVPVASTLSL